MRTTEGGGKKGLFVEGDRKQNYLIQRREA
jgi:hypothetical protein